jgi:hypothetical protein
MNIIVRHLRSIPLEITLNDLLLPILERRYWTVSNGPDLRPIDFETEHLRRTIKYIEYNVLNLMTPKKYRRSKQKVKYEKALAYAKNSPLYLSLVAELNRRES